MCAIFGSFDTSMFEVLYEANKQRGNFASSVVSVTEEDQFIQKTIGDINFDKFLYLALLFIFIIIFSLSSFQMSYAACNSFV